MLLSPVWIFILFLPSCFAIICPLPSSKPAVHNFNWSVFYTKENPDGFFRRMIVINDNNVNSTDVRFPGPTIYVCKGDEINVYLENRLPTESISLHWHGIHQKGTPWMDGVQQVTQYPILPTQQFHYRFVADKVGTHWYHSHTGGQYTDGLFGMLIVGDPYDPYKDRPEHLLFLSEWYHNDVIDVFDIFIDYKTEQYNPFAPFIAGLTNGKGRFNCTPEQINDIKEPCNPKHPFTRFNVSQNEVYRLRIISAGSQFSYKFSIDKHELTIVAMDGVYVQPYTVQEMFIDIGQRYDVLVNMTQPIDVYWIRVFTMNNRFENVSHQFNAVLQYVGASSTDDPHSVYYITNRTLDDSKPLIPDDVTNRLTIPLKPPPEFHINAVMHSPFKLARIEYIDVSCNERERLDQCFINGIRYRMSKKPILLSLKEKTPLSIPSIELSYNESVIFIINNYVPISHPLHIHGHDFYILASGRDSTNDTMIHFNNATDWNLFDLEHPPIRDTFKVPRYSWVALGLIANNPGSWLFHCHITFDMEAGMARVLNVGGTIPEPPEDFPIIGEYRKFDRSKALTNMQTFYFVFFFIFLNTFLLIGKH